MYHSVSPEVYVHRRPASYRLSPEAFEQHLIQLRQEGFSTVGLEQFLGAREGLSELPARPVVITFDDGYLDNFIFAWPRLRDYGFRACFFITVSTLGEEGMMNTDQIRRLIEEGNEIGSHGLNHDLLAGKNRMQLQAELTGSKTILSRSLGTEVRFFSLPRGYQPLGFSRLVRQAGYRAMCTSTVGYNSLRTDPFRWKRFPVRTGWNISHFQAVINRRGLRLGEIIVQEAIREGWRWRHFFKT